MKDRTPEQTEAIKFHYNMNRLNKEVERYNEGMSLLANHKNTLSKLDKENENVPKLQKLVNTFEDIVDKSLADIAASYIEMKNILKSKTKKS